MLSSSGFRDALGERDLRFDRESGQVRECLALRPELAAYHRALGQRIARLASLADERLVPVEDVEHEPATGRVTVVTEHISGLRLQQVLRSAREHELVPDLTIALFFTTELLTAVHSLHTLAGVPHGAISPDRIIATPTAQVVLADYAFGEAIEAAHFAPRRLWHEFGIASPLGEPFSIAGDIRQSTLAGIALMLGRPLDAVDMPDGVDALLIEVEEAAMIRGGRLFAEPVVAWLTRALGTNTYDSAQEAALGCAALLTDRERATARPAFQDFLEEIDRAPAAYVARISTPAPEPAPAIEEEATSRTSDEPVFVAPEPAPEPEPQPEPSWPRSAEPEPEPRREEREPEPIVEAEYPAAPAAGFSPEPLRESEAEHEPEPEPEVMAEPMAVNGPPPPGPTTSAWPPPPTPALEVDHSAGPRVISASPFALVQGRSRSNSPSSEPPTVSPSTPPPVQPAPGAAPWSAPKPLTPSAAPPFVLPVDLLTPSADGGAAEQTTAPTPIRLKGDTGIRLKDSLGSATKKSSTSLGLDLSERSTPEAVEVAVGEEPETHARKIPWKYVAAAFAIVAAGFAATTFDWRAAPPPDQKNPVAAPAPAPESAPAKTGALQVLSNNPGSKVLIDGTIRGETPLTIDDLEPGRHVVIVRAPNGNVRRTITIAAGKTTTIDLVVYSGWVVVSAPIELQVFDGEKSIGNAGEGPLVLTAGPHTVVLVNEALGYRSTHPVDVQPGEEERIAVDPTGSASFNAVPWAEVWMEDKKLGETPLGNVEVPLGTREFTFKNPQFGDRKVSATITGSSVAQISVDFTKP